MLRVAVLVVGMAFSGLWLAEKKPTQVCAWAGCEPGVVPGVGGLKMVAGH